MIAAFSPLAFKFFVKLHCWSRRLSITTLFIGVVRPFFRPRLSPRLLSIRFHFSHGTIVLHARYATTPSIQFWPNL